MIAKKLISIYVFLEEGPLYFAVFIFGADLSNWSWYCFKEILKSLKLWIYNNFKLFYDILSANYSGGKSNFLAPRTWFFSDEGYVTKSIINFSDLRRKLKETGMRSFRGSFRRGNNVSGAAQYGCGGIRGLVGVNAAVDSSH